MKKTTLLLFALVTVQFSVLRSQTDVTSLISNPSFETGNLDAWTTTGADGYAWIGTGNDSDGSQDGVYSAGVWNRPIGDVEISQTLTDLPNGFYKVSCLMSVTDIISWTDGVSHRSSTQRLFAYTAQDTNSTFYASEADYSLQNLEVIDSTENYGFANNGFAAAENGPFYPLNVVVKVTDGTMSIGARTNGNSSVHAFDFAGANTDKGFVKFDDFTLFNVDTATLENVSLSVGSLDVAFDPAVNTYSATLPKLTTSVTPDVMFAAEGINATGLETVDMSSGTGTSTIEVTCLNGSKKTYTINYSVLSVSDDADLLDLTLSAGTLSPSFSKEVTSYTGILPLGTASVTPTATVNNEFATVTAGNGEVTLTNGHGKSEILITAEDGTTKTYTIVYDYSYLSNPSFEEGAEGNPAGWSITGTDGYAWVGPNTGGDATKDGSFTMGIWNGTIGDVACSQSLTGLSNGTYVVSAYMVVRGDRETTQRLFANSNSVLYGSHTDYPEQNIDTLKIKLNENVAFGNYAFSDGDEGPFKKLTTLVEVTDGNLELGVKVNGKGSVHGFDFSYTDYGAAGFSKWDNFSVSDISSLVVNALSIGGDAVSEINKTSLSIYHMELPIGTTDVPEVVATVVDATAKIEIVPAASLPGSTEIIVTSEDSSYSLSYYVNFTVAPSSDATLSNLTTNVGTLDPVFNSSTFTYALAVPVDTTEITLTAVVNEANATVVGDGLIDLSKGDTTVMITVTAEDLSEQEYTVSISLMTPSSDATLSNLTTSVGTLDPIFDASTLNYALAVSANTTELTLTATNNDPKATVVGDGLVNLSNGGTTVTITVTAEDLSVQEYTVNISMITSVSSVSEKQIIVYPTVSSGSFYVNVPLASGLIELYDISGNKILSRTIANKLEEVSIENKGIFIMKVTSEGTIACVKLIKQ